MTRFVVVETWGYLTAPKGKTGAPPGVSATVIDDLTGRELATYRSEDHGAMAQHKSRALAIREANEYAARLEAEYGG